MQPRSLKFERRQIRRSTEPSFEFQTLTVNLMSEHMSRFLDTLKHEHASEIWTQKSGIQMLQLKKYFGPMQKSRFQTNPDFRQIQFLRPDLGHLLCVLGILIEVSFCKLQ